MYMDFDHFIRKLGFYEEDIQTLSQHYHRIKADAGFLSFVAQMRADPVGDLYALGDQIYAYAASLSIHPYTLLLLVLCASADVIRERMLKNGASEEIFWDSVRDFRYKAYECKRQYGVIGTYIPAWYGLLYQGKRFALGRLQYEIIEFPREKYVDGDTVITKGMPIINVHIPSSGRLDIAEVNASIQMATEFFAPNYNNKFYFFCESWLLYPAYLPVFEQVSQNIYKFARLFHTFETLEQERFEDCWRIFYTEKLDDLDALPRDTALQRAFVAYMKNGGKHGEGYAMLCVTG